MADKPILFSAPMIRALLREIEAPGTGKTQTRRTFDLQGQPIVEYDGMFMWKSGFRWGAVTDPKLPSTIKVMPGDRLWVRESGTLLRNAYDHDPVSQTDRWEDVGFQHAADGAIVAARYYDTPIAEWIGDCSRTSRPSIHMPRWASRITLIVTDVRVQRLQEISADDVRAEGVEFGVCGGAGDYRGQFIALWNSINGPDAWAANPWVAAYTFRPIGANVDAVLADPAGYGMPEVRP